MKVKNELKQAVAVAKKRFANRPEITKIGIGFKEKDGKRTGKLAVVVGVEKKLPVDQLSPGDLLPSKVEDQDTDVTETGIIKALGLPEPKRQAFVQRQRPCPPGHSIGHVSISAGTLGAWVKDVDGKQVILSNNHVLADSNGGSPGDKIIQPGKADGGYSGDDWFARLGKFVAINFDGGGGVKKNSASKYWRASKWLPNFLARKKGCEYRLVVSKTGEAIEQPSPNLVDAALATPLNPGWVSLDTPAVGEYEGFASAEFGEFVQKVGRTTEHTKGEIVGIDVAVRVNYGDSGNATFDDQLEIKTWNGKDFSAGGDSGSAIIDADNRIVGLLFAGGGGTTIANRIENVVALLAIRF